MVGAALYLPGVDDRRSADAPIPTTVPFQEKWRQALTVIRQVRASGIQLTGVLADADFGDKRAFRGLLHRLRLPYAVGVSTHLTAFRGTPRLTGPRAWPGSHRGRLAAGVAARPIAELVASADLRWRRVQWRNRREARVRRAECAAMRVTPALDHRQPRLSPEFGSSPTRGRLPAQNRFFYINLPEGGLATLVALRASAGNPIEQQYSESESASSLRRTHLSGRHITSSDGHRLQLSCRGRRRRTGPR